MWAKGSIATAMVMTGVMVVAVRHAVSIVPWRLGCTIDQQSSRNPQESRRALRLPDVPAHTCHNRYTVCIVACTRCRSVSGAAGT